MTINLMGYVKKNFPAGNWKNVSIVYKSDDQSIHLGIGKEFALTTPLDADTPIGRYVLERLGRAE